MCLAVSKKSKMLTFHKLVVTVGILSLIDRTSSFSLGAPDSACSAMMPGHSHPSQSGSPPANLTLTSITVLPGEMIGLELVAADNSQFKGFIIQARSVEKKDRQIGSFVVSGDDASYMACGRGTHNSITHRKSNSKSSMKAQWRAPTDFEGEVVFRYTYLKEYQTFWVGLETAPVRISRIIREEPSEVKLKSSDSDDTKVITEDILDGVLSGPQRRIQNGPFRTQNASAVATAGCDPDYGWIPGVDGTKCYMVIKDQTFSNCYIGSGDYYYGMTWFESMSCCYANHGYMAEPVSQEEHDLIKNRLAMVTGEGEKTAWWLGGADWFNEGEWRWNSGQAFSFTNWHEGEPNDSGNEDCVSMSSQEDYQWEDLGCNTASHSDIPHYVVCERSAL